MLYYVALIIITLLTGRGILLLAKIPVTFPLNFYLAPLFTLVFWSLTLGWGVSLNFPVKILAPVVWVVTLLLMFVNFLVPLLSRRPAACPRDPVATSGSRGQAAGRRFIFILIFLLPVMAMFPYFQHGISNFGGFNSPDGWSYVAVGQYLWDHTLHATTTGLSPLYQFAVTLQHERFISSALLSFWSPLLGSPGDTQLCANLLFAWSLYLFASALAFFGNAYKLTSEYLLIYLLLVIFSGWIFGLFMTNNYDNALALCFLPATMGIFQLFKKDSIKWSVVIGFFLASFLYCYVEMSAVLFITIFLFLLQQSVQRPIVISQMPPQIVIPRMPPQIVIPRMPPQIVIPRMLLARDPVPFSSAEEGAASRAKSMRGMTITGALLRGMTNGIIIILIAALVAAPFLQDGYHNLFAKMIVAHQPSVTERPGEGFFSELHTYHQLLNSFW